MRASRTLVRMSGFGGVCAALLALMLPGATAMAATPAPAWSITPQAVPTNFVAGDPAGTYAYVVNSMNVGGKATNGTPVVLTDTLPPDLEVKDVELRLLTGSGPADYGDEACVVNEAGPRAIVTCTVTESLPGAENPATVGQSEVLRMVVLASVPLSVGEGTPLVNEVSVSGGGAATATSTGENVTAAISGGNPIPADAGFAYYRALLTDVEGKAVSQAGSHPYQYTTSFAVNTMTTPPGAESPFVAAGGDVKDVPVTLPPGLVGNPLAAQRCTPQQFNTISLGTSAAQQVTECPNSTAVGIVIVQQLEGGFEGQFAVPIFNLVPPRGMPAQFGFQVLNAPFYIDTEVRSDDRYKIVAALRNSTEIERITAGTVVIWGTPADEGHDGLRGNCTGGNETIRFSLGDCPAGVAPKPFLRLPTQCSSPFDIEMSFDTWFDPGTFVSQDSSFLAPTGCNLLSFDPTLKARPTTNVSDSPSGLSVDLAMPQEEPLGFGESDLRKAVTTLPKGIVINPSGANGLEGCSSAQIGYQGIEEGVETFSSTPAACPDASRIGTVEVNSPLIDHPLPGSVYVAMPTDNPFGSLLAIYIAIDDPQTGVVVKLAGHVEANPDTGQLTATFSEAPQIPFEHFKLNFFSGSAAALRSPALCGNYSTSSELTPWAAPAVSPVTSTETYGFSHGPNGLACATTEAQLINAPAFEAGTVTPIGGAYSPFVFNLKREDGSQELSSVSVMLPPGVSGKLAGIPYCPEAAIAAAASRPGKQEQALASCPSASEIGSVTVGAGAGPLPYYAPGKAYLAGPYKGAPLSMVVVTPAVAGPYDLGTVVVRAALYVDPETARITAKSDPLPRILQGIPVDVRSIALRLDRPAFTRNPTSCNPYSVIGESISVIGQVAPLSNGFQVGSCGALGFGPKMSLSLTGGTRRTKHPALKAVLTKGEGQANLRKVSVTLPATQFIDQDRVSNPCTRPQFAEGNCPAGSILGRARIFTPLLSDPLEGKVYFRANGGERELPDIVLDVNGQIHVTLVGIVDAVVQKGTEVSRVRTRFLNVPDQLFSKAVIELKGGKEGLLVNSANLCKSNVTAVVQMDGQNGKTADSKQKVKTSCGKKQSRRK